MKDLMKNFLAATGLLIWAVWIVQYVRERAA